MITPLRVILLLVAAAAAFLLVVALCTGSRFHVDRATEVFSVGGKGASGILRRASQYLRDGMIEEATAEFERAKELAPLDPFPYARLAQIHAEQGSPEAALRELEAAEKAGIAHVELNMTRSLVYQRLGEWDEAIRILEETCHRFPDEAAPYRSLGWILLKQERAPEAIAPLREVVRLEPDMAYNHLLLGRAYAAVGREAEARRETQEAARREPGDADALAQLGWMSASEGRFEEAAAYFSDAVERHPAAAGHRMALAHMYEKLGRSEQALEQWERAGSVRPEDPAVQHAVGRAYERHGLLERAARSYHWALALGGPDPQVASRLATVLAELGDSAQACSIAAAARNQFPDDASLSDLVERLSASR